MKIAGVVCIKIVAGFGVVLSGFAAGFATTDSIEVLLGTIGVYLALLVYVLGVYILFFPLYLLIPYQQFFGVCLLYPSALC